MNRWLACVLYVAAVVAANVMTAQIGLVSVGFGMLVTAGTFAAGFALLARDLVHRAGGVWLALGCVLVGCVLSWWLASPGLALASGVAFLTAEFLDLAVFAGVVRRAGMATAIVVSNVLSAPVDTVVFLHLAGFPVTMAAVSGQFVGKIVWATLLPLAAWGVTRALLREPVYRKRA